MTEFDREMRALLDEDARHAPTPRDAGRTIRRTRSRQLLVVLAGLVAIVAFMIASFAGVSALIRSSEHRTPLGPDEIPSPRTLAAEACPLGSTPDEPGPADQRRPGKDDAVYAATAFDRRSGRMLMLTTAGAMWTFDVCSNTWEAAPAPEGIGSTSELVDDIDSGLVVAIDRGPRFLQAWTFAPDGTWIEGNQTTVGAVPGRMFSEPPQAVYDPVTGLALVRDQFTSGMWSYDVETDAWTEVDQGTVLPPVVEGTQNPPVELLTYDASVDRLILYVTRPLSTWEFDIRAGRWSEQGTATVVNPGFGWFATGEELAYDEANEVSVLFSGGTVATYDASEHRWNVLQGGTGVATATATPSETTRLYFAMTYDPVNERIVIAGGDIRTWGPDWRTTDDVIAFDVETGKVTQLLAPTAR